MRVCFISFEYPPNVLGGAGTYAEILVRGLKRLGVDVFIISRGNQHDENGGVYRVPVPDLTYWRRLFFMKSAITLFHGLNKQYKFDLVHFNEPHVIIGKPKLPTVSTLHSTQVNEIQLKLASAETLRTNVDRRDLFLKGSIGSIFDFLTAHATDKIICPSPNLASLIKSYCLVDENKILVIPNGIDLELLDRTKCDDDATTCLKDFGLEGGNYILFIGRLSVLKGAQYAIEAFKSFSMENPDFRMAIVGKGDFENSLKNIASGMRNVVFTGYVDSLKVRKALYENSLFVIVPSLYEALPMVILEAMACSKAVLASNVGGIPYLLKHGKNGFLSKPGDPMDIEKFMKILCEDEKLRKRMGSLGRRLVEKEFSVEHMANRTVKVYESLCSSNSMLS